jgi:hypothetical protein
VTVTIHRRGIKIGSAWQHQDDQGFNLRLDLLPINGHQRLAVRPRAFTSAKGALARGATMRLQALKETEHFVPWFKSKSPSLRCFLRSAPTEFGCLTWALAG